MALDLRSLDPGDGCQSLKLGDAALNPLKSFLRGEAKRLHKENLAKTFVMVEPGQAVVRAYVTVLCTHVAVQQFTEPLAVDGGFRYKDYPAIKLARLAVDARWQGQGVGGVLVDFVMGLAVDHVMPNAGCRFLVLDAKPNSVSFYESKGFTKMGQVVDGPNATTGMFIDLHKIKTS